MQLFLCYSLLSDNLAVCRNLRNIMHNGVVVSCGNTSQFVAAIYAQQDAMFREVGDMRAICCKFV